MKGRKTVVLEEKYRGDKIVKKMIIRKGLCTASKTRLAAYKEGDRLTTKWAKKRRKEKSGTAISKI